MAGDGPRHQELRHATRDHDRDGPILKRVALARHGHPPNHHG
eukprot:CAMPEP_0117598202 /NCGR_PEP_ID=MMETSP0784-20121206/75274_1 /TAXON_ID=39447 /ORGANISM="" /LENGTH=41 /DNA_ID= /DNA_START= /DNA_END= /DNA_ORIENTATION=